MNTGELIYFDNAATTFPKPEIVYQTMDRISRTLAVNAGRGSYTLARQAEQIIAAAKHDLLCLVHGEQVAEAVFAASATIACNQIIGGIDWKESDTVYVTPFEHNAVIRPLHLYQQKYGYEVVELPLREQLYEIDLEKTQYLFSLKPPRAVFATHISNVIGYLLPVRELFEMTKAYEGLTILDASQSIGLAEINMKQLPVDYLVFAGHKNLYGPLGIGGCLIRTGSNLNPCFAGGTGSDSLNPGMPAGVAGLEFSSPNIVAIAGLQAAIRETEQSERRRYYFEKEQKITADIVNALKDIPDIKLYLPEKEHHVGIVACNVKGYYAADIGTILDEEYQIAVRTGYHCAPLIHKHLKSEIHQGVIRISMGRFTTAENVLKFTAAIREIAD